MGWKADDATAAAAAAAVATAAICFRPHALEIACGFAAAASRAGARADRKRKVVHNIIRRV